MTRIMIDINDVALAEAARVLGTKTKVETVNRALAEVGARKKRLALLTHLRTADDDLGDPEVMADAWR